MSVPCAPEGQGERPECSHKFTRKNKCGTPEHPQKASLREEKKVHIVSTFVVDLDRMVTEAAGPMRQGSAGGYTRR